MMKNRDEEALRVIRMTGGHGEDGARKLLAELRVAHEKQEREGGELNWKQTLLPRSSAMRGTVFVAVALGLAQQLTGTEAILYYTPVLFKGMSETHQFLANLSVGGCKFVGELFAAWLSECVGRRTLMIYGNLLLCMSVFGIAASFQYDAHVIVSVVCLSMVMLTFSIGPGPFTFVVVNEMLPLKCEIPPSPPFFLFLFFLCLFVYIFFLSFLCVCVCVCVCSHWPSCRFRLKLATRYPAF